MKLTFSLLTMTNIMRALQHITKMCDNLVDVKWMTVFGNVQEQSQRCVCCIVVIRDF